MPPLDPESSEDRSLVESAIDGLYRLSLEAFVSTRNALAKQLKDRGDPDAAKRVRALKKPGLSAWVANRLWWDHAEAFGRLLDAARRVGAAQQTAAGPGERSDAERAKRDALKDLLRDAERILVDAGHAASAGTLRRYSTNLEAVAAHRPDHLDPPPGRLVDDLDPPGFDLLSSLASMGAPAGPPSPVEPAADPATGPDPRAIALERARAALETATSRTLDAVRVCDAALRETDQARAELERLQLELQGARAQLDSAQQRVDRMEHATIAAKRDVEERSARQTDAEANAAAARAAEAEARTALAQAQS